MPLTERKDVFVISTPGHTVGHQSVVIDLGERQVIIAGDAAFDDQQVRNRAVPGIFEDRERTLQTYEVLHRAQQMKPTLHLFTHDPSNRRYVREMVCVAFSSCSCRTRMASLSQTFRSHRH